jgi:hypothetical protein
MVAKCGRRVALKLRQGAAALIDGQPWSGNAGEMGWIPLAGRSGAARFADQPRSYVAAFIFEAGAAILWIASPAVRRLAR